MAKTNWVSRLANQPMSADNTVTAAAMNEIGTEINAHLARLRAGADVFIDFTTKPNGNPPSYVDTGQGPVDFVMQNIGGAKPLIQDGELVHGDLPASGAYADYYQIPLGGDARAFGARWRVNSADGSTMGSCCIAAWANVYEAAGTIVPRHAVHVVFSNTGVWNTWVSDGLATANFIAVKQGTFTAPASDGVAIWEAAVDIDAERGVITLILPGNDSVTGTRKVTVTNAEIAAMQTSLGRPVRTIEYLMAGTGVVMCEHFASSPNGPTAIYPRFLSFWADSRNTARDDSRKLRAEVLSPQPIVSVQYNPAAQQANVIGTSTTVMNTNGAADPATITVAAGPKGIVKFLIPCACVDFGGSMSRAVTDGVISAGSANLTSATAQFSTDDVGSLVRVAGAGTAGGDLVTTIASRTSATVVVLSDAAVTEVASGGAVRIFLPTETILYARMSASGGLITTPNPTPLHRGRAGTRWVGPISLLATGLTPGQVSTWTFAMSMFPFGTGTATLKFGGINTTAFPPLKIWAIPA